MEPNVCAVLSQASCWICEMLQPLHVQAAKNGNTEQMGVLASMLDAGYGCTADPLQAKVWAHKAAQPDNA